MDVFSAVPPPWAQSAIHAHPFGCPQCGADAAQAQAVWVNRRAPVYSENHRRKWQEFYHCGKCETSWWGWSSDRPPTVWSGAFSLEDEDGDESRDF